MRRPLQGKLVSSNKGEYAGPCPIKGGEDRFHWWLGSSIWFCRKECPDCPGRPTKNGIGRWGIFEGEEDRETRSVAVVRKVPLPSRGRVDEYLEGNEHDPQLHSYLASRGIDPRRAIMKFHIGKNCRRLTIPCIVTVGDEKKCYGIKKRWLGTPPEEWIPKYTMEPGSQGTSIFNYDKLVSKKHWPYFLIVEGVLDCVLLDQLKIPAIAPFGGGGVWSIEWNKVFRHVDTIYHVADRDLDEDEDNPKGLYWAKRRLELLGRTHIVYPPGGYKDVGEAHVAGEDLTKWKNEIRKGGHRVEIHSDENVSRQVDPVPLDRQVLQRVDACQRCTCYSPA